MVKKNETEKELDKLQEQFQKFDDQIKELTLDQMNKAPILETEPQSKLSSGQIANSKDIYLKPNRTIGPGVHPKTGEREKFNEKFRPDYNFQKEYVHFTAFNNEIVGEEIEIWTKPFGGINCEFWKVPCNKPVWGPRYLAEQIRSKTYHKMVMDQKVITGSDGAGQYYGAMAVQNTVHRLNAEPVSAKKSVFVSADF